MYKKLCAPITCQIEVTSACNQKCGHCYNFWRQSGMPERHMTTNEADIIIGNLIDAQVFGIVLTGGEPLINKTVVELIARKATDSGISVGINSNLTLISDSKVRELQGVGIQNFLTSLLGPTAEVHDSLSGADGSFLKVLRGIDTVMKSDAGLVVNMVVSKKNIKHVYETAKFVKSLGVRKFTATKVACPGNCMDFSDYSLTTSDIRLYIEDLVRASDDFGINIDMLEGYPVCGMDMRFYKRFIGRKCQAGITTMTVSSNGDVRPCSHLDVCNGNLLNESVQDVWDKMSDWRSGVYLPDVCKTCKLLPVCNGGCRMEAKMLSGGKDFKQLDPNSTPERIDCCIADLKKNSSSSQKTVNYKKFRYFQFSDGLKWRKEDFGLTLVLNGKTRAFLDEDGARVVEQVGLKVVEVDDPRINWGSVNPDSFISNMARRGMVKLL